MAADKAFKSIGICGGGKMGGSFFNYICGFDFEIVFYIRNPQKLEQVRRSCTRSMPAGRTVIFTDSMDALGDADIVFEFISEDLQRKRELINRLMAVRRNPAQVIATGSSSLTPGEIFSEAVPNIIGVHFIYPVQYIKTVEVVYRRGLQGELAAGISDFLLSMGKTPVLLDEDVGAVSTRVLVDFQNEAFLISREQQLPPGEIDELVAQEGYAMPPFELTDNVGFDVTWGTIGGHFGNREEVQRFEYFRQYLEECAAEGRLGRKTGRGFFKYGKADNGSSEDFITSGDPEAAKRGAERLKAAYLNSCLKLLDGCWIDSTELDEVFSELSPAGLGPVTLAFEYGLEKLLNTLEKFAGLYGEHLSPPGILGYAVKNRVGREELDRQIRLFNMGGTRPGWLDENFGNTV